LPTIKNNIAGEEPVKKQLKVWCIAALAALGVITAAHAEDPIKVGVIIPMTGPFQSSGKEIEAAINAFTQKKGDIVAGRRIEFVIRDDRGAPENAKRLAQELIAQDRVSILTGFGTTPAALSVASLASQAKIPEVVMVAATSSIVEKSPYIVRVSQSIPQIASVIGQWAPNSGAKNFVSIVSEYGPGLDAEEWFAKTVEAHGGRVIERLKVPVVSPDFAPFLQRAADAKPDALFVFVPAGVGGNFMKQFVERGLDKAGMRLVAMSDLTDDDLLNNMGDAALGAVTGGPYSASHDSPENKAFVAQFKAVNPGMRPNIVAVSAWDALELIYRALETTKGDTNGDALVAAMKGQKLDSPRGPISIDPATRDIVQNIYMRKVERHDGELYNMEFETFPNVKDPAH
jgi:branched-chain amino acid transport system substrate-binding protein